MNKFFTALDKIEQQLCVALLMAIVLLVFIAAIMRSFFQPIIWSVEIAQMLFIWLCMLSADLALKQHNHAVVDVLFKRFSLKNQRLLQMFFSLFALGLLAILLVYGMQLFSSNSVRKLGSTEIAYAWVSLAIPVGAGLMIITLVRQLFRLIANKQECH